MKSAASNDYAIRSLYCRLKSITRRKTLYIPTQSYAKKLYSLFQYYYAAFVWYLLEAQYIC